ncbi:MAG: galactokinase [Candidatus Pacearchaeota archaeon]|nr:galactokinase [Candidatus Pacearchaeota archaeon]
MIITRAPLRLSIGGGGTDLPFYSSRFGASLVTAALDKYIYIIVKKRDFYDEFLIKYSKTESVKKVQDIQHTRIKAALEYLDIKEPLEIVSISDVPSGTGLGSSSAFLVALLKALHTYKREHVSTKKLAEEACDIEINILKEPIGKQDQYASAFGGLSSLDIDKQGNVVVSPLNVSYSTLEQLEQNTLMFYTGVERSASEILTDQAKKAESEEDKMNQMHLIRDIGLEIKKALEQGEVRKFGQWLNVHWETKKKFTNKMSSSDIDMYYETALKNGALGGKLVGAGGGGFLLFYCEDKKRQLREAILKLGLKELPFRLDMEGCKVLYEGR